MCLFIKEHLTTPPANICIRYANTRATIHSILYYNKNELRWRVVTLLRSRRDNPLSLSFFKPKKGDKRKQNGREKDGLVYVYNLYARVYI
jgi:hypothetical protein